MSTKEQENVDVSLFGEADPLVGKLIGAGRWKVTQFLGEGSLSSVYRSIDKQQNDKPAILKRVHPHLLESVRNLKRFEQKVRGLLVIESKYVGSYKDVFTTPEGQLYLVVDEMVFESLEDVLSKSGHIAIERAINIFKQVCLALEQGMKAGLQHRDLKPSNIIILNNERFTDDVKLVDFGIAKLLADESQSNKSTQYITQSREVFGSPLYLSPEQCTGKRLDLRTDIYSLGCVIYETVTGKPPFVGKNVLETAYKHMNEQPKPLELEEANPVFVKRLETLVFKCLEKEPVYRYQTIEDIKHDLDLLLVASDEEWQSTARAFRADGGKKRSVRGLPISSEILLFAVMSVIILGAASFLVTSGLGHKRQQYPALNNDTLWVVDRKSAKETEVEGFGARQDAAKDALDLVKDEQGINSEEYANALSNLVELYANSSHWEEAEEKTRQLIDVTEKVKGPWPLGQCYRILGYVCFMQGKDDDSLHASQKAVAAMDNDPLQQKGLIQPLRVMGDIYNRKNDLEKGISTYEKLFSIVDIIKESEPATYADTCSKLADLYRKQGKFADAERYYRLGLEWWKSHNSPDTPYAAKSYYGLGLVLLAEGKYDEAKQAFEEGIPIATSAIGKESALVGAMKKQHIDVLWRISPFEALKAQMTASGEE